MKILFLPTPQNAFIRGLLTISVGALFLGLPGLTLRSVVMTVGGMILLSGIISLLFSRNRNNKGINFGTSFQGFFNILWGLLFLFSPMTIVKVFGFFFGVIFILLGIMQLFAALGTLSKSIWSWIYLAFSVLLISGGVFLLTQPIESAEKILLFLGAILVVYGILELTMAWRLKNIPKGTKAGNVVDTTYEEV
jgi:uncharacterized membrane protein HdeD (DUF308 family)